MNDRQGAMPPASLDTSALYATEHGTIDEVSGASFDVRLGDREWSLQSDDVHTLHDALQTLAAQVYRCNCDCRWQLRLEAQTLVLDTDEVLRLHSLLNGAMAMLELHSMLDDVSIARPR